MVVACDVGQGDGVLIQQGFVQVVVDGGPDYEAMSACLSRYMPFWDRTVELVINSHPQLDHFGGLRGVFDDYLVGKLLVSETAASSDSFLEWVEQVRESGAEVVEAYEGVQLGTGDITWDVLWPPDLTDTFAWEGLLSEDDEVILGVVSDESPQDVNEVSVVAQMRYGELDILFTGDIGMETEEELVQGGRLTDIEVLKVAHHGSKNSSSEMMLDIVKPEIGLIQVSNSNSYGHPHDQVIQKLKERGVMVYRTDELGDVLLFSDGNEVWVK
jgi:competence protein ComEC